MIGQRLAAVLASLPRSERARLRLRTSRHIPTPRRRALAYAAYNWGGLYVGGQIGGSWTNESWTNTARMLSSAISVQGRGSASAALACWRRSARLQRQASNYVFVSRAPSRGWNNHGTLANPVFGARDDVFSWRSNWMATVTGRVGIAANNNLFYAKGGYAGVDSHLAVSDVVPPAGAGSDTRWHNGWTVGAGWEYGLTQNWIVGLEYDYAAFAAQSYQLGGRLVCTASMRSRATFSRWWPGQLQVQRTAGSRDTDRSEVSGDSKSPGSVRAFCFGKPRFAMMARRRGIADIESFRE